MVSTKLKLFNTLSGRKEVFQSLSPHLVKMFVCGPTIQDSIHIGHARTYIFYDVLARYLAYLGYKVEFILNVTDIDESIVSASRRRGEPVERFLERSERAFLADMKSLRISTVRSFERVSSYFTEMIQQVSGLVRKRYAYRADGGVFFDVSRFPAFGRLSHQSRAELALRPLEISPVKRNQMDFSLWRAATTTEQRWESPWGIGTPGWHIQDTAVSIANFGPQYDIHGGARELIYPHHEAEIAQAEALTGIKPFVKYWVHTGLLTKGGKKMSKSAGDVYYVRDLLRRHDVNAVRLYFVALNHRADAEFDERSLSRMEERYHDMRAEAASIQRRKSSRKSSGGNLLQPFLRALNDDLDGPRAIRALRALLSAGARESDRETLGDLYEAVSDASGILGVELFDGAD